MIPFIQVSPEVDSPFLKLNLNKADVLNTGVESTVIKGYLNPSPSVLDAIQLIETSTKQPVFWKYFDNPSDNRMGNFLLVLANNRLEKYDKNQAEELRYWAYFADQDKSAELCSLIKKLPSQWIIYSRLQNLKRELNQACGNTNIEIVVIAK